jgi:hypothetical protein
MDMPISVMVSLFVAVVVGAIIITFARTTIMGVQNDFIQEGPDQIFFEVESHSVGGLKNAITQCNANYRDGKINLIESDLCFVINARNNVNSSVLDNLNDEGYIYDSSAQEQKTLYIRYRIENNTAVIVG